MWGEWQWGDNDCLRDQFAMAALTGLLASGDIGYELVAGYAYSYADAMMEERMREIE